MNNKGLTGVDIIMITFMFSVVIWTVQKTAYTHNKTVIKQIIESCELIAVVKEDE